MVVITFLLLSNVSFSAYLIHMSKQAGEGAEASSAEPVSKLVDHGKED